MPTVRQLDFEARHGAYHWTIRCGLSAVVLAALMSAGCGPRSGRLAVGGTITLNGAPLESGAIRFTSVGSTTISSAGAMVERGEYYVPQEQGLLPGKYHVEISSPDEKAPPILVRDQGGGPGLPVQPDRIPPEYNINSKQSVEVTAGGDNRFDFDIQSQRVK